MRALYEIDQEIMNFDFEIDEETGEILNFEDLDNLKMEREHKIESVALWYKNLLAEKEMVKAEKNAFADREKRLERKIEGVKGYLTHALAGTPFSTSKVAMSFRKSESVEIDPEINIPKEYCIETTTWKPNKKFLKECLKAGEKIAGVRLVENQNLQIK